MNTRLYRGVFLFFNKSNVLFVYMEGEGLELEQHAASVLVSTYALKDKVSVNCI